MYSTQVLSIVFVLFWFSSVTSDNTCDSEYKNVCNLDDDECIRWGANNFFKTMIAGVPCVVEPSDPLHLDEIIGHIYSFKYRLTNVSLTGLIDCRIVNSNVQREGLLYQHYVFCPKLVINTYYEAKGKLGPVYIDGEGLCKWTANNYGILFIGKHGQFLCKKDNKTHYNIIRNRIETDPKGKLLLEAQNLSADKEKSLAYINSNWKTLEKYVECPIMSSFISYMVKNNLDKYLRTLTLEQVFPKQKCNLL